MLSQIELREAARAIASTRVKSEKAILKLAVRRIRAFEVAQALVLREITAGDA